MRFSEYASVTENGWFENEEIVWVGDIFPDDVIDILMEEDYDENEQISNEEEFESLDDFSDFEN